jgi:hypothetical protein
MVRRPIGLFVLSLAAGVFAPAASAPPASAASVTPPVPRPPVQRFGVRLVDVPVSEAKNPRALRYIIDYLPTGTVIHRRILVVNQESHRARFTVYADAATIGDDQFIGGPGATRSALTTWTTVQHPVVTLGPDASAMDMVTIRVPRGAVRGEHYGVIWVQQESQARDSAGVNIREIARVGVRIYLAVGRGGAPPTRFAITAITGHRTSSGQPYILAGARDTGGRAVDLSGSVRLTQGPGGTSAGPFQAQQSITLAPGQSGEMTFKVGNGLPNGPWLATVTLASGLNKATGAATVTFAASAAGQLPLTVIIAAACVLAVGVLVVTWLMHLTRTRHVPA